MSTYFAMDGNYGDAHGVIIIETIDWTMADWMRVEEASDHDRIVVATTIALERS